MLSIGDRIECVEDHPLARAGDVVTVGGSHVRVRQQGHVFEVSLGAVLGHDEEADHSGRAANAWRKL